MKLILMLTTYALVASGCPFLDRKLPHNHNHQPHLNESHVSHIQQFEGQNNTNNKSPPLLRADNDLINQIREDLRKFMETFYPKNPEKLATVARLGFHSCVGGGGCFGCLNLDDPDNKGLGDVFNRLSDTHQKVEYKDKVSRADFLAAAANFAIEETVINNNRNCQGEDCIPEPNFEYFFGRKDSDRCKTEFKILPAAHLDYNGMTGYFRDHFNMEPKEVVALMGVHTLGRANLDNSGFNGEWVDNDEGRENERFNNKFYKQIVDPSVVWRLKQESDKPTEGFWFKAEGADEGEGKKHGDGFRLISTISMYKRLKVHPNDAGKQVATCGAGTNLEDNDFKDCPASPLQTYKYFDEFAGSNEKFMEEFKKAFTKMLTKV